MKIIVRGTAHPIHRVLTGWYSFDNSFMNQRNEIGFPMRGLVEVYGNTGCGKTTFALSLCGLLSKSQEKGISFVDLEGFDPEYSLSILENSGFEGELHYISGETDEKSLDELIKDVEEGTIASGIFDSVGAVSPIAEIKGDLGEANMGRRAILMAAFSRKLTHQMKTYPDTSILLVNHLHPNMGYGGNSPVGGKTIGFLSTVRLKVNKTKEEFSDGSFVIHGVVDKNRYGMEKLEFDLFVLAGVGIHKGMTALLDCRTLGLATGDKRSIKLNGEPIGNITSILNKAREGDSEFFVPFIEALEKKEKVIDEDTEDREDT